LLDDTVPKRPEGLSPLIVVQARMGSTRLPGKVLKSLGERSMLAFLLDRLSQITPFVPVIVATTSDPRDEETVRCTDECGVAHFCGSEEDVLDRFYRSSFGADTVIRITADCPLSDPVLISKALDLFYHIGVDYLSNTLNRTYPRGFDVEIFSRKALEEAFQKASSLSDREHVTGFITSNSDLFSLANFVDNEDMHDWRLTVDTKEDLALLRRIVAEDRCGSYRQIKELLRLHPEWKKINEFVKQKET